MLASGLELSSKAFRSIAQTCLREDNLECNRFLLRLIVKHSLAVDPNLGCQLIRTFISHNCLPEANRVFNCLAKPNKFTWCAIILANATLGQGDRAVGLYHHMHHVGLEPDGHIFVAALKGCANARALAVGKLIEIDIKASSCNYNTIIANAVIDMYVKCGSLENARRVFKDSPNRDVITWNTMISGYASYGHNENAFDLFSEMLWKGMKPDPATFVSVLKACDRPEYLVDGNTVHAFVVEDAVKLDVRVGNTLIRMYALCGSLEHAYRVFDNMPKTVVVTWNAMISGYIDHNKPLEAMLIFQLMQQSEMQANCITFLCIIRACTAIASIALGKQLHALIMESHVERDGTIGNALIDMYAKCGDIEGAHWIFTRLLDRVIITWNTLISGFIQHGQAHKAFECFSEMLQRKVQPDQATFVSILTACLPGSTDAKVGLEIHALIIFAGFEGETIVANSLIDMYTKFGDLKDAHRVFDKLWKRDAVSWNTLMTGYIQHLENEEALALFLEMQVEGGEPDCATFLCVLKACCDISAVDQINTLLHLIVNSAFEADEIIQSSFFNLYVKCDNLKNASCLSLRLQNRDLVTWNALIAGYAQHGNSKVVEQLFKSMQSEGVQPDETTFLSLLATISHVGSLAEAPDIVGWTSLLEHSKTHANLEVGRRCYSKFVSLDKEDASGYVLVWKIFSQFWLEDSAICVADLVRHVNVLTMSRKESLKSRGLSCEVTQPSDMSMLPKGLCGKFVY
ncbi:hypothetical protein L7F22_016097 [Adiantum nelumboides]|nr:hypothetical protein [Adiantum nelumboides]